MNHMLIKRQVIRLSNNVRDWSFNNGEGGGGYKWENRGSKTFCALLFYKI